MRGGPNIDIFSKISRIKGPIISQALFRSGFCLLRLEFDFYGRYNSSLSATSVKILLGLLIFKYTAVSGLCLNSRKVNQKVVFSKLEKKMRLFFPWKNLDEACESTFLILFYTPGNTTYKWEGSDNHWSRENQNRKIFSFY